MPQNRRIRMPSVGDVVQSIKGRDRYRVFLVVDMDESDKVSPVVIADGRLHKLDEKKHKNPRGNPKRSLIIPSRRDLTNAGKCDKIKAQRESGAFKNTDPVFGIARQDRFVADRLGTPAFAAGAPFFFRRGREENQNV